MIKGYVQSSIVQYLLSAQHSTAQHGSMTAGLPKHAVAHRQSPLQPPLPQVRLAAWYRPGSHWWAWWWCQGLHSVHTETCEEESHFFAEEAFSCHLPCRSGCCNSSLKSLSHTRARSSSHENRGKCILWVTNNVEGIA